jgi:hypothetical protein
MLDLLAELAARTPTVTECCSEAVVDLSSVDLPSNARISRPVILRSSCRTRLLCGRLSIRCEDVTLDGFDIVGSLKLRGAHNATIHAVSIRSTEEVLDSALVIVDSSHVSLSQVTISGVPTVSGLAIRSQATVKADRVTVSGLQDTLVVVTDRSKLVLTDSKLLEGDADGVYVAGESSIQIQNSWISSSQFSAIFVDQSSCILEDNTLVHLQQNGISLNRSKNFRILRNRMDDVDGSAIAIVRESCGEVSDCELTNVKGNGLYIAGGSDVIARRNRIMVVEYPAVAVLTSCSATITDTTVRDAASTGFCVRGANNVTIENLSVERSSACGISVSDTHRCIVRRSRFKHCGVAALESYNWSNVEVTDCECIETGNYVFQAFAGGVLTVTGCWIRSVAKSLCQLSFGGSGIIVGNRCDDVPEQFSGSTTANFVFKENGAFQGFTNSRDNCNKGMKFEEPMADDQAGWCLKCGKNQIGCFFLNCGHRAYCTECGIAAAESSETCPLCRWEILKITPGFASGEDGMCSMCLDRRADCIVTPCGHMGFCRGCIESWYRSNASCPICRAEPSTFKTIVPIGRPIPPPPPAIPLE